MSAHLWEKLNIDHNTFAKSVPSRYRRVDVNFDSYDELLESINLKAAKATRSKVQKQKLLLVTKQRDMQSPLMM